MSAQLTTIIGSVEGYAGTILGWLWPAFAFVGGLMLAGWILFTVIGFIMAVKNG